MLLRNVFFFSESPKRRAFFYLKKGACHLRKGAFGSADRQAELSRKEDFIFIES